MSNFKGSWKHNTNAKDACALYAKNVDLSGGLSMMQTGPTHLTDAARSASNKLTTSSSTGVDLSSASVKIQSLFKSGLID